MGYRELIEALRREGEEKVRLIWKDVEAEAEKIRDDGSGRINRMREDFKETLAATVEDQNQAILSEADRKAHMVLLSAEKELSDRLYGAAVDSLALLREKRYPDVFEALVHELPPCHWQIVRVHPDDEGRAREYFPDAEIICDRSITAGLDVMEKEGRIRVINSFEKRLDNLWMDILPALLKDICGGIADYGIAEKS